MFSIPLSITSIYLKLVTISLLFFSILYNLKNKQSFVSFFKLVYFLVFKTILIDFMIRKVETGK